MFRHAWRGGMLRVLDNGAGTGGTPDAGSASEDASGTPAAELTFETWYAGLEAPAKRLFAAHIAGLKTALDTERTNRAALAKQLTDASTRLEAAERRAAFAEDAIKPEIGCTNVKAAFALATAEDLFDRHGRPDWNALKATAPELFRKPTVGSADGGAGTNQGPKLDMNTLIRRAAGRG